MGRGIARMAALVVVDRLINRDGARYMSGRNETLVEGRRGDAVIEGDVEGKCREEERCSFLG